MLRLAMLFALVAASTTALVGCGDDDDDDDRPGSSAGVQPQLGSNVVVQFRRDYLGAADSDGPVSATAGNVNGTEVAVAGKLVRVSDEWVVIESQGRELWVPKSAVLYLDVSKAK